MQPKPVLEITLPYPPSVNGYWRWTEKGPKISKRGRQYALRVKVAVLSAVPRAMLPLEGELEMEMDGHVPDLRKDRDVDNIGKAPLDAMERAGVYINDSQIRKLTMELFPKVKGGRLAVRIFKRQPTVE